MAGAIRLLNTISASNTINDADTAAIGQRVGRGCSKAVTYFVVVRSIGAGDTWDVDVVHNAGLSTGTIVAQRTGITAAGIYPLAKVSGQATNIGQIYPNRFRVIRQVAGGTPEITADFYEIRSESGSIIPVIGNPVTFTDSADVVLADGNGAFMSISPWVGVSAITGTWTINLYGDLAKTQLLATSAAVTGVSSRLLTPVAPYNATRVAIPYPRVLSFVEDVAGSITIPAAFIGVV